MVGHVIGHKQSIERHISLYRQPPFFCLFLFLWQVPQRNFPMRNRSEPFFRQSNCLFERDIAGHSQYCIIRSIKTEKECLYFFQRSIGNMRQLFSDRRPLIRMRLISQRAQKMSDISIRLVQTTLFELFHYHSPLYLQAPFAKVKTQHPVGFQPKAGFYVLTRYSEVVIGYIIIRPGIILSTRQLKRHVIIGNIHRPSEHQVFEQMGKAGMLGIFVASSHII